MKFEQCRKFREDYQARSYLKYYHVALHLLVNLVLILIAVLILYFQFNDELNLSPLLIIASLGLWGILEYGIHRFLMHKKLGSMNLAYKEHTLNHHFYYVDKFNFTTTQKDFVRIFFQPLDVVLIIYCANFLFAFMLYRLVSHNFGLHFFLVGNAYYVLYEFLHYIYHSNKDSFFQKIGLFKWLIRHHHIHHDQNQMNDGNFSLLFPLLDRLFGTYLKRE
ncbi:MAG: sterol desaturase family protein [Bacteriovorax sp.]